MGFDDLVHFNKVEYAFKLTQLSNSEVKIRERIKIRQSSSGWCTAGATIGAAVATGGTSLVFTAYAARKIYVARQKLRLLRAELGRRNIPLHTEMTTNDYVFPILSGIVGLGVGFGVEEAMLDVGYNGDAVLATDATAIENGGGSSAGPDNIEPTQEPTNAQEIFQETMGAIAGGATMWLMRQLEDPLWKEKVLKSIGCAKLTGYDYLVCDKCEATIDQGIYAHCCECDDDYDICLKCYKSGQRCPSESHPLVLRQFAICGLYNREATKTIIERLNSESSLQCDHCGREIRQGRLYTCDVCRKDEGGFNLCMNCYYEGYNCDFPTEHCLYVFLSAEAAQDSHHMMETAICNICSHTISQGLYYSCNKDQCKAPAGLFNICHACYEVGGSCQSKLHYLKQHLAYKGTQNAVNIYGLPEVNCDGCADRIQDKYCYHCNKCERGRYDVCSLCYAIGTGCKDPTHTLSKLLLQ